MGIREMGRGGHKRDGEGDLRGKERERHNGHNGHKGDGKGRA